MIPMAVAEERLTDRSSVGETLELSASRGREFQALRRRVDPFERP